MMIGSGRTPRRPTSLSTRAMARAMARARASRTSAIVKRSRKSGATSRILLLALCLSLLFIAAPVTAAGSWVASAPPLRVIMAERESRSAPLQPPASVTDAKIVSLGWRFKAPPGADLRGRICQAETCVAINAMRGRSQALVGLPATKPLRFHFSLAPGQRQAVVVQGLQLIVNYQ